MQSLLCLFFGLSSVTSALAVPASRQSGPTVSLSYGTFQGTSSFGADKFLGMPFAQAERFGLPHPPENLTGIQQATAYGAACPQQGGPTDISEDCLFINVIKPSNIPAGRKLPILFWIYGGAFEIGDTSQNDGSTIVTRSISAEQPVLFVSANYRVNAFGFLASAEVKAAGVGNLGFRDQRFALQWVQDNIALFGGDPSKVIIWGGSAGAFCVGFHMLFNGGDTGGLFRGAFMESGGPIPLADISSGQPFYDQLVTSTNCSTSADAFACLKGVPFSTLQNAINEIPSFNSFLSLHLSWQPLVDGVTITRNPIDAIVDGAYAKIPMITGNADDEGTGFSFTTLNLTTDAEAADYLHHNYLPQATDAQFQPVAELYPSDPTQGSPFDTGILNQLTPQFKRIAAVQGDLVLQAPRRFFIQVTSKTQDAWGYLYKRGKLIPFVGAFHGSEAPDFYGTGLLPDFQGTDAIINFANNLDPNVGIKGHLSTLINWPKYSSNINEPPLLTFLDLNILSITPDTYRVAGMKALMNLFPFYAV